MPENTQDQRPDLRQTINDIETWGTQAQDALRNIQEAAVPFARDPKAVRAALKAYFIAMKHAKASASLANKIKTAYEKVLLMHGLRPLDDDQGVQTQMQLEADAAAAAGPQLPLPIPEWAKRGEASLQHRWGNAASLGDVDIPDRVWFAVQNWLDKYVNNGLTNEWTPRTVAMLRLTPKDVKALAGQFEDMEKDDRPDLDWLLVPNYVDEEATSTTDANN